MKKENKGITLIALVITIIILLILAAIVINLTIGQRGILNRAEEAGRNYTKSAKEEDEKLSNFLKEADDIIDGINGESKPLPENARAKKVEIGDYVAYDPITDVEESKLSYTSPVGTGLSHGNGKHQIAEGQTFTATSGTKWRVLSKDETTGEVLLISEKPITADTGLPLIVLGGVGYLYYEQELNEICKIYGYGKGANTSKTFVYKIGDVVEGEIEGIITGSGARSITAEDINKITKYDPSTYIFESGGTTYGYGYEHTHTIYHPSMVLGGISETARERTDVYTGYNYRGSEYLTDTSSALYQMIFSDDEEWGYAVATRAVYPSYRTEFSAFYVAKDELKTSWLVDALDGGLEDHEHAGGPVRPIVYLKSNIQTNAQDASGAWIISE